MKHWLTLLCCLAASCALHDLERAPESFARPWNFGRIEPLPKTEEAVDEQPSLDRGRTYDLAGLIDIAQRHHPQTRMAWEAARRAAIAVGLAESTYLPQLSADIIAGFQHTPLPVPKNLVPRGYFTSDTREVIPMLSVKWLLFDFGQRAGAVEAASTQSFIANVAFTAAHQKLVYEVSRDYFALGATRGRRRVAEQALANTEVVAAAVQARREHGTATVVEEAQSRRQLAQTHYNLERARGAEHVAYAALIGTLGIEPDGELNIADSSTLPLPAAPEHDVDQLIATALCSRPDVARAIAGLKTAKAVKKRARGRLWPQIALTAQVFQNIGQLSTEGSPYYSVNNPGANILLGLSWPLFDGGERQAHVAIADSEMATARAEIAETRDRVIVDVTKMYDTLSTSFAERAAADALEDAAHVAYEAALDAMTHGVGNYTDVVNAETALAQARFEKENAHANVLTAAAGLAFATGQILQTH